MTLGEFANLLGVEPKWVQNAGAVLGPRFRYTLAVARRLALARALNEALGMPLPRAYAQAADVFRRWDGTARPVRLGDDEPAAVDVTVDVYRIQAEVNVGVSRLRTLYSPRRRGRPAGRRDPVEAATAYGIDTTLLAANLRREPAERLRQLDAMVSFRRRVRRG